MRDKFAEARYDVWRHARAMWEAGLVVGSSGNVSARVGGEKGLMAITPTQVPYAEMSAEQIVIIDLASGRSVEPREMPSYELPMHRVIFRQRDDVAAIVHTHSPFVTTLSVLRKALPPVIDEMMVYFGGTIEVADYAFTGTEDVGLNALRALADRPACMLANHGNVCIGGDLAAALQLALAMEAAARIYVQALQIGEPVPLPKSAIDGGRAMFEQRRVKKPAPR